MRPMAFASRGGILLRIALIALTISPLATVPAWPIQDEPEDRATLKGVTAIRVAVTPLPLEIERSGLRTDQLQTDVELRLRQSGITLAAPTLTATPGLWIDLTFTKIDAVPVYAFSMKIEFLQYVRLSRDLSIGTTAPTWGYNAGGYVDTKDLPEIRPLIRDLVDKFINAYLEQNPKQ